MSNFLNTPAAHDWAINAIQRHSNGIFGTIVPAVIWSDARGDDGELLVDVNPVELVNQYNSTPIILLHNHDPGRPKGQVLECANFESDDGQKFVTAVFGYYTGGDVLDFRGLDLDTKAPIVLPKLLPVLPNNAWILVAADPRDVEASWLDQVTSNAPLRIKHTELSHNAADSAQELIRVALPYLALVWNPLITSIASEAGKETYAAIKGWCRRLIEKLTDLRNPILDIQSHQDGCQVSFHFRSKDVKQNYAAFDELSNAAAQAAAMVARLKAREMTARQLIYEFDKEASRWFPSYAILNDNRIITDNRELIAIEQLPTALSLGLHRDVPRTPEVKSIPDDEGQ